MFSNFHFEVTRLAGYFSFLIAQWFSEWLWHELPGSSKIWNMKIYSRHAWESLRSVTFLPLCLTRSWWNSAPWAATSTPGVWTNKAFFVLSCQAEKRDHLRLPGGALRLHIFMSHIFTKFSRYPRRFCSNVHSSSDGVTTVIEVATKVFIVEMGSFQTITPHSVPCSRSRGYSITMCVLSLF